MSFWVALRGVVCSTPEEVDSEGAERVAAFLLADAQYGRYGDQVVELDQAPVCEVVLRGDSAEASLRTLKRGDAVVALGNLKIAIPFDAAEGSGLVSLSVEAYSIGRDLARPVSG
jgi:hypothetical protein